MLAYLRTALALMAAGVAVRGFVEVFGNAAYDTALGVSLLGLGPITSANSFHRWFTNETPIRRGAPLTFSAVPRLLAYVLTLLVAAVLVGVLIK